MSRNTKQLFHLTAIVTLILLLTPTQAPAQPTVEWGTYLGGTGNDFVTAVAVDSIGNVYAAGQTESSGWVTQMKVSNAALYPKSLSS